MTKTTLKTQTTLSRCKGNNMQTHSHSQVNANLYNERVQTIADLARLQDEAADIRGQLEHASMRKTATGQSADSEWFQRASSARRIKLSQIRQLQARLAEINIALKTSGDSDYQPVEAALYQRLNAALAVCREAVKLYDEDDLESTLTKAIDNLDDTFPEWEDVSGLDTPAG